MKKVALIGTVNRDTILAADGTRTESYGGLLYSTLALGYAPGPDLALYPICSVGEDVSEAVLELLNACPRVCLEGVTVVPRKNPHCLIRYRADGEKEETLLGDLSALSFEQIAPFLKVDAICANFITGFELSAETLGRIRTRSDALICMDVHSLTLGIRKDRRRFLRAPENWEAYVRQADVVQVNKGEAHVLNRGALNGFEAFYAFGVRILEMGPSVCSITLGDRGSFTVFRGGDGEVESFKADARFVDLAVDQTGCGDVFLAGFVSSYLRSSDVRAASHFSNRLGGANCCLRGIEEMSRIGEIVCGPG